MERSPGGGGAGEEALALVVVLCGRGVGVRETGQVPGVEGVEGPGVVRSRDRHPTAAEPKRLGENLRSPPRATAGPGDLSCGLWEGVGRTRDVRMPSHATDDGPERAAGASGHPTVAAERHRDWLPARRVGRQAAARGSLLGREMEWEQPTVALGATAGDPPPTHRRPPMAPPHPPTARQYTPQGTPKDRAKHPNALQVILRDMYGGTPIVALSHTKKVFFDPKNNPRIVSADC